MLSSSLPSSNARSSATPSRPAIIRNTAQRLVLILLLTALGAGTLSIHAQQVALVTLPQLKDRFRPLLVFAPRPDDPQLEIQLRTLEEHAAEAQDRDYCER